MATINETSRLLQKIYLMNLMNSRGLFITPLISGTHGIGKTAIVRTAAEALGGTSTVIEGGLAVEGDVAGFPLVTKDGNGESVVTFIKHPVFRSAEELEKVYYEKANNGGFLGGRVRMEDGLLVYEFEGETHRVAERTEQELILQGSENKYKFGDKLPKELKLELIKSGEIAPLFILIDEMNRAEKQTMKEFMNVSLNKEVQLYQLPWWVQIVAAQNPASHNSSYATNEVDGAQLDRFLKIVPKADLNEFTDYMARKYPVELVEAVASLNMLVPSDKSLEDTEEMDVSPRSWEIAVSITENDAYLRENGFYNYLGVSENVHGNDLYTLLMGKVGRRAATAYISAVQQAEVSVKPSEVINGISLADPITGTIKPQDKGHIKGEIKEKMLAQKSIRRRLMAVSIIRHLCDNWAIWEKNPTQLAIVKEQLTEYITSILDRDVNARTYFIESIYKPEFKIKGTNIPIVTKLGSAARNLMSGLAASSKYLTDLQDL